MKYSKMILSCLAAILLLFTLCVGAAAADCSVAVKSCVLSDTTLSPAKQLTFKVDSSGNVLQKAYAKATITLELVGSDTPTVTQLLITDSNFSADENRSQFACPHISRVGSGNTWQFIFDTLYYWGPDNSSYEKDLDLSIYLAGETDPLTVTVPVASFTTQIIQTATPTPTVAPKDEAAPYLTGYCLTTPAGGEITGELQKGDVFNMVVRVTDPALPSRSIDVSQVCTRINSAAFTYTGLGEISQYDNATGSYIALFRNVVYNGNSSEFTLDVWYTNCDLPMHTIKETFGVLDADPAADIKHTSSIIVREVDYGSQVTAGENFVLKLTLFSSIGEESISDVVVNLTLPEGISVADGSQSGYVASMKPRSTASVSFVLCAAANMEKSVADIGVNIYGTGAVSYNAINATSTISIPISQPERFEITKVEAPTELIAGQEGTVVVTYVNKGKKAISNLSAVLTGTNMVEPVQNQYLGNVNSGTENTVEFNIVGAETGALSGTVVLTYESSTGKDVSQTEGFSATVEAAPDYSDYSYEAAETEPTSNGLPVWAILLIVIAAAIVGIILFRILRKRRIARQEAALEQQDEEDEADGEAFHYQPIPPSNSAPQEKEKEHEVL